MLTVWQCNYNQGSVLWSKDTRPSIEGLTFLNPKFKSLLIPCNCGFTVLHVKTMNIILKVKVHCQKV